MDHLDTLRQLCVSIIDMVQGAQADESQSMGASAGRFAMLAVVAARSVMQRTMQRTAHLNA
eukprot:499534-Amphidinium_carterae.1